MSKNKSIICAIVKDEQRFIHEWVEHCLASGFEKLYIFEDYGSASHEDEIEDYIKEGKVKLNNLDKTHYVPQFVKGTHTQGSLYAKFLRECKKENFADWVGFFDVDEFIMFEDGWNLEQLEEDFNDCGGILLSWRIFGANGHLKRPKGNVVDNYTTHMPDGFMLNNSSKEWQVKSLVNVERCSGYRNIHVFSDCKFTDRKTFIEGKMIFCKAWLNHYYTKSWEDYLNRIFARGNMQNNFRCLDGFFLCNPDMRAKKKEMVEEQRYRHAASTMWISREMKIISGGNIGIIDKINKKYGLGKP